MVQNVLLNFRNSSLLRQPNHQMLKFSGNDDDEWVTLDEEEPERPTNDDVVRDLIKAAEQRAAGRISPADMAQMRMTLRFGPYARAFGEELNRSKVGDTIAAIHQRAQERYLAQQNQRQSEED